MQFSDIISTTDFEIIYIYIPNNVKTKLENKDCGSFYIFAPINFNCYDIRSVLESRQYFT